MTDNTHDLYEALKNQWIRAGGVAGWHIGELLWADIRAHVSAGVPTFETGSGLSTWLFAAVGCSHVALESSPHWFAKVVGSPFVQNADVLLRELVNDPPWYSFSSFADMLVTPELLLIDGPSGDIGRAGVLDWIEPLLDTAGDPCVFVDDVQRNADKDLAKKIGDILSLPVKFLPAEREAGRVYARIGAVSNGNHTSNSGTERGM